MNDFHMNDFHMNDFHMNDQFVNNAVPQLMLPLHLNTHDQAGQ